MTTLKFAKQAAAALLGIAFAGSALAIPSVSVVASSTQGTGNTAHTYAANYNGTVPAGASFSGGNPFIAFGSASGNYKTPFNGTPLSGSQSFFSVGGASDPSPTSLNFGSLQNSFSLLWGSIDGYNTISFLNGNTAVASWTGGQINALLPGSGERVALLNFAFGNDPFSTVTFKSTSAAFEFALPGGQVPEPGTLALLGLALGVAGVVSRRRKA